MTVNTSHIPKIKKKKKYKNFSRLKGSMVSHTMLNNVIISSSNILLYSSNSCGLNLRERDIYIFNHGLRLTQFSLGTYHIVFSLIFLIISMKIIPYSSR